MLTTIKDKVTFAGIGMLVLCGLIAGAGVVTTMRLNGELRASQNVALLTRSHMDADMMHDAIRADVLLAMATKEPGLGVTIDDVRKDFADHSKTFRDDLANSKSLTKDKAVLETLEALDAPIGTYVDAADSAIGAAASDPATAAAAMPGFLTQFHALEEGMSKASDKIEEAAALENKRARELGDFSMIFMLAGLVAGVTGAGLLIIAGRRIVVAPLEAMSRTMTRLADGDTDAVVHGVGRADEIGAMAKATETFRLAAKDKIRLEAEAEAGRLSAEEARKRAEAQVLAAERSAVVSSVGQGMTALVEGKLTYRMPDDLPSEYAQLRADFNAAMVQLEETMASVRTGSDGIDVGADEISQASDDLSRRTEQQAASLEETAAALDEITATVKKTASGARQASDVVTAARGEAQRSGQVVAGAVAAMDEIEKSSSQIGQIIGVIDEIAFQTNLLALNAGVEAARAGDAGKGFAVVASEVRALAQRSAEAAKEIKTLIGASTAQVGQGVSLVGETGKALQSIVSKVAEIDTLVSEIAASAQEQSTGLTQVNSAVNQMDQVVQQNAAMVEEATAAAHSLKTETRELSRLVERFEVGAVQGRTARASAPSASFVNPPRAERRGPDRPNFGTDLLEREPAPVSTAPHAVTETTPAAPSPARAMTQRLAASFGSAAVDSDGWEEF